MLSLENILKERIQEHNKNPTLAWKNRSKDYEKTWNKGVMYFMKEINKEREKFGFRAMPFIAIRKKLVALREIDDLRWFYYHCKKYSKTKDKYGNSNTFCKCYFGALRIIKK